MCRSSDMLPLRALEDIALYTERAIELDRKANAMHYEADDLPRRAECIREHYQNEVERLGYEECVRRADADDERYTRNLPEDDDCW